jgi:predicted nucleotidyltransferase
MASVQAIRQRLRGQRIEVLRSSIEPLLAGRAGAEVWLFGSLARGDWDARSDGDLLAVAPDQSAADQLAEALLEAGLADDVIGLSQGGFHAQDSYPCCQAAEKALKAVLLALDQEPERTDSIERLLGALELLGIETARCANCR